mgnify:CR=1 FL=1
MLARASGQSFERLSSEQVLQPLGLRDSAWFMPPSRLAQAATLVEQLQRADARDREPIDPALPLELARARREVEQSFAQLQGDERWMADLGSFGLVGAGINLVARWLKRNG